jgi:hypothetical protein
MIEADLEIPANPHTKKEVIIPNKMNALALCTYAEDNADTL